ncbi:hypothetical protein F2Q69_00014484 [Brassica cretica]|uniref:Uncharacterized protein n=1 Tax=Brassica cretica TaxID=69181 RepID=A0A8S9R7A6_BRACR|nr:hypothetical protein F2Q69_00014484 [Brassica cretica]
MARGAWSFSDSVEVSTSTFLRLQIGQIGSWKTRGFLMVRISGIGELVSGLSLMPRAVVVDDVRGRDTRFLVVIASRLFRWLLEDSTQTLSVLRARSSLGSKSLYHSCWRSREVYFPLLCTVTKQVEVSTFTFLRLRIGQIGSWKTRGFLMVRISGIGELVSGLSLMECIMHLTHQAVRSRYAVLSGDCITSLSMVKCTSVGEIEEEDGTITVAHPSFIASRGFDSVSERSSSSFSELILLWGLSRRTIVGMVRSRSFGLDLGFGELVSDSQSDGVHYAFGPSSGVMEMEGSVVVLFTLQEVPNSFYEKVEASVTPVVDIDFFVD